MAYTPEQLGAAYKAALQAGDTAAADELATALNAAVAQAEPAPVEASPLTPEEIQAAQGEIKEGPGAIRSFAEQAYAKVRNLPGVIDAFGTPRGAPVQESGYAPNVIRYGVPIAAGIATAPATVPMGALAGAATLAGVGLGSGYGSDAVAQFLEKGGVDQKQAFSQGFLNMTPFKGTGALVSRAAWNAPTALGFSELSQYIANPEGYAAPFTAGAQNSVSRVALPVVGSAAISSLGSLGEKLVAKNKMAEAIRKGPAEAAEYGISMGREPLLQDLFPTAEKEGIMRSIMEPAAVERAAINRNNPVAAKAVVNAATGPSAAIYDLAQNAPSVTGLSEEIRSNIGKVKVLADAAKASREEAQALAARAEELQSQGLSDAPKALEIAKAANLRAVAQENAATIAYEKIMGRNVPELRSINKATRDERLLEAGKIARDARATAVNAAYAKAGIGENDAVVSMQDIMRRARSSITANEARKEFTETVQRAFGEDAVTIDNYSFKKARDRLAAAITQKTPGIDPNAASRQAGQFYETMKEASLDYMKRERADVFPAWEAATERAANFFRATDTDAYALLSKGDSDAFIRSAKAEGAGGRGLYGQIKQFADTLEVEGAKDVSDALMRRVNDTVRDGLLDSVTASGTGFSGARLLNPKQLAAELQSLHDKGFPIGQLGLGDVKSAQALARIASVGGEVGYTPKEVNAFLDDVSSFGLERAAARKRYTSAVRDDFLTSDPARKLKLAQVKRGEARRAALDSATQQKLADEALSDPLVRLLNEPGSETALGLSKDPAGNGQWVQRLLTMPPETLQGFRKAMVTSGRTEAMKDLEKATVASLLGRFERGSVDIDIPGILTAANDAGNQRSLKAILGPEGYQRLDRGLIAPIRQLAATYERARLPIPNNFNQIRAGIASAYTAAGKGAGPSFGVTAAIRGAMEFVQNRQLNRLYALYIDPVSSASYARLGYNLDRFMQQPANAAMLRVADHLDKENNSPKESD